MRLSERARSHRNPFYYFQIKWFIEVFVLNGHSFKYNIKTILFSMPDLAQIILLCSVCPCVEKRDIFFSHCIHWKRQLQEDLKDIVN